MPTACFLVQASSFTPVQQLEVVMSIILPIAQGLQLVEQGTGQVVLLASHTTANSTHDEAPAVPIRFANDLHIASDGTIFFSDSQSFPPALNAKGYFDVMQACVVGLAQVEPLP